MIYEWKIKNERLNIKRHASYLTIFICIVTMNLFKIVQVKGFICLIVPPYSQQQNSAEKKLNRR